MIFLKILWLLLPAAFANMAPVIAKPIFPEWNTPVDVGFRWNGIELFGNHKTYRGFVSGAFAGFVIFYLQQILYHAFPFFRTISFFNYEHFTPLWGAWIGFGALLGDLLKSFVKRRLFIEPGKAWIPFDQIDWIIGGLLSLRLIYAANLYITLLSLMLGLVLHFLIKYIGYLWKLSPTPL